MSSCEFCEELNSFGKSRIGKTYRGSLSSRIVYSSESFFIVPTIAPIVSRSYLILPKEHHESYSSIAPEFYSELEETINKFEEKISRDVILFEHGAKSCTGSGCGIYHAHIHIVPIESVFSPDKLVGVTAKCAGSLSDTLKVLQQNDNYILYRDNNCNFYYNTPQNTEDRRFVSQYFRRWLTDYLALEKEWDWKKYVHAEEAVIDAVTSLA